MIKTSATAAVVAAFAALFCTQAASAQDVSASGPMQFRVHIENDGGPFKRNNMEDRYYTSGVAFVLTHHPAWARQLAEHMPFGEDFDPRRTGAGHFLTQQIFTPADLSLDPPDPTDRPYAGHLYGGVFWERANDATLDRLELAIGVVGRPSLAEQSQKFIHDWLEGEDPQGWQNQMDDEPTFQLSAMRAWRMPLGAWGEGPAPFEIEALPEVSVDLGTAHRQVEIALTGRAGWNIPRDFGPGRIGRWHSSFDVPKRGWTVYVFGRVAGRAVQHNMFLDGSDFRDGPDVTGKPLVGELTAGLTVAYRRGAFATEVSYAQTLISESFENQRGSQELALVTAAISWGF